MKEDRYGRLKKAGHAMSAMRRLYTARLAGRCMVLAAYVLLWLRMPEQFEVLEGWNFFRRFSILHGLWLVWIVDMTHQLIPAKKGVSLGSQKHFRVRFEPARDKFDPAALKKYIASTTKLAYGIFAVWVVMILVIGWAFRKGILDQAGILFISVLFYVGDLVCVLVWCPFRLIVRSRCCTTCRIFNWDRLMMVSPLVWVGGFFSVSLVMMAAAVWVLWEASVYLHPERFWEYSNEALKCVHCTDKLCTQYCGRRR